MALVEAVAAEVFQQLEDLFRRLLVHAVLHAAGHEVVLGLVDDLRLFLAHGPPQHIGGAQGKAAQGLHDLHHLLLIEDDAVGLGQDGFQQRMLVGGLFPVAAGYVILHHTAAQRPGPVEGHHGDDVLETGGLEVPQVLLHALAFQLEHGVGVAGGEHLEGLRIVQGDVVQVDLFAAALFDVLQRVVQQRQGAQAQQVHLYQTAHLYLLFGVLGGDGAVPGVPLHRHIGDDLLLGDGHARGVLAAVGGHALDLAGDVQQLPGLGIGLVLVLQVRAHHIGADGVHHGIDALFVVDDLIDVVRDHLHHPVGLGVGDVQHPAYGFHRALGQHVVEGHDLTHVVAAVFIHQIVHHLAPAHVGDVGVDIRRRDPLRVEEAFEQQVPADGVDVGDMQGVGHDGAGGGTPARADGDALLPGVVDHVPHDEEIAGEIQLADDAQLVVHALPQLVRDGMVTLLHAVHHQLAQVGAEVVALRHLIDRHIELAEFEAYVAALGDSHRVFQGFRPGGKNGTHLLFGLEVELVVGKAHAVLVRTQLARLDAQQYVVHLGVGCVHVVQVVGGHQPQVQLPGDLHQLGQAELFLAQAMVLQLDEEIVRSEDVFIFPGQLQRLVVAAVQNGLRYLPCHAGGQADQALAAFPEHLMVHPGLIVKALGEALGHDAAQVPVAGVVLRQQDQVAGHVAPAAGAGKAVVADVDLAADDGLHALVLAFLIKVDGAVHHAVIGDGAGGHAVVLDPGHQAFDLGRPVQQAVFGMVVKMNETHVSFPLINPFCARL